MHNVVNAAVLDMNISLYASARSRFFDLSRPAGRIIQIFYIPELGNWDIQARGVGCVTV